MQLKGTRGSQGVPSSTPVIAGAITIVWHKFVGLPSGFIRTFGKYYGIYIWGDAEYTGCALRRQGCVDQIYIGQCGGGARREEEDKTGGGYVKGSLNARYRPGSYTNFPDAEDVSVFNNGNGGIIWERPKFFGSVEEVERPSILDAEGKIINLYFRWIQNHPRVKLVNNSIPSDTNIIIINKGNTGDQDIPFLLRS